MMAAVALGPVFVAIEADKAIFQQYSGGIITSKACGTTVDHAVLLVGYDDGTTDENGTPYFIV